MSGIHPEVAYKCLANSAIRKSWDLKMTDLRTLGREGNTETKYYVVKSNIPLVGDRDVVVKEEQVENYPGDGIYCLAFTSCEHPEMPVRPNYTRASNHFTGYKFSPAPEINGAWMEWIQNLDVNGEIPAFVFRMAGEKMQLKTFQNMRAGFDKEQEKFDQ